MSIKILIFDYKNSEKTFFSKNKFENYDLNFFEESLNEISVNNLPEELLETTEVISVFISSYITKKVLNKFKNLKIIATRSTGFKHIDVNTCCKKNIKVLNVEEFGKNAVAQYTFGLIISILRKIPVAHQDLKNFHFNYNNYIGRDLNKLTIGVMGTGTIGAEVCRLANAFNMKILAFDINKNKELTNNYSVKYTTKEDLIKNSDIITLHLPSGEATKNVITRKEFANMKSSVYIINTSRGELINTEDLYNALIKKSIAGAALDVTECEEIIFSTRQVANQIKSMEQNCLAKGIITRIIAQMPNVIATPHVAYNTQDALDEILKKTFDSIENCIQGGHANQVN
ncbi:MAG: NAD(P)-dependent oxidoreductase [Candidatus Gastranaerophilaceae bacterium]